MEIKELFAKAENGTLTYEQFEELAKGNGAKFTDLSDGKYVSKSKYEDELKAKDSQIEGLNTTISSRDGDLATLKKSLEEAGTDSAKLGQLNTDFANLQTRYDTDTKALQEKLALQEYEFAVKEFAGTKKFTSNAAKRDFVSSMLNKKLQMDSGKILGAEDFVTTYSTENADAFLVETPAPEPKEQPTPAPHFVAPTGNPDGANTNGNSNPFNFNFAGVRAHN